MSQFAVRYLARHIRAALGSWWALIGIVTAGIAFFRLMQKALDFGLSPFLRDALLTYVHIFHFPFDLVAPLLHIRFQGWEKDLVILAILNFGALERARRQFFHGAGTFGVEYYHEQEALAVPAGRDINLDWEIEVKCPAINLERILTVPLGYLLNFLSHIFAPDAEPRDCEQFVVGKASAIIFDLITSPLALMLLILFDGGLYFRAEKKETLVLGARLLWSLQFASSLAVMASISILNSA